MASVKDRKRKSAARRRAEAQKFGFESTTIRLPEGLRFFEWGEGTMNLSVVPYIAGKGNPHAEKGEEYFERTFWVYSRIGADENMYVSLSKTFGKKDPIAEERSRESRKADPDKELLKALRPKERNMFLVYDHDNPDNGVQLLERSSYHFGDLLFKRIDKSDPRLKWENFYFPDEDGFMLQIEAEEQKPYGAKAISIDFIPREEPLPDEIINHGFCLDDLIVELPYEQLRAIFLMEDRVDDDDDDDDEGDDVDEDDVPFEEPAPKVKPKPKSKPKPEPEEDEDDEPAPKPKSKAKPKPKTASDVGLERGDEVIYKKGICSIAKISPDGTSLTLLDADDEMIKAIGVDEVKPVPKDEDDDEPTPKAKSKSKTKAKPKVEEDDEDVEDDDQTSKSKAESSDLDEDDDEDWDFDS